MNANEQIGIPIPKEVAPQMPAFPSSRNGFNTKGLSILQYAAIAIFAKGHDEPATAWALARRLIDAEPKANNESLMETIEELEKEANDLASVLLKVANSLEAITQKTAKDIENSRALNGNYPCGDPEGIDWAAEIKESIEKVIIAAKDGKRFKVEPGDLVLAHLSSGAFMFGFYEGDEAQGEQVFMLIRIRQLGDPTVECGLAHLKVQAIQKVTVIQKAAKIP